jgi:GntR family transcriptional regulator, transcriptional repressor for pyruvate dehydrogenase complex
MATNLHVRTSTIQILASTDPTRVPEARPGEDVVPLSIFPPINWPRASEAVLRAMIDGLRRESVPRGSRLPRDVELARHFGVGRIVVREALEQLRLRGMITARRGKGGGVFVADFAFPADMLSSRSKLNEQEIHELLEARRWLETATCLLAARHADAEDLRALEELVDRLEEPQPSPEDFIELDIRFHLRVADASRNDILVRCVTGVLRDVSLLRQQFPLEPSQRGRAVALQRALLEAIRAGDLAAVRDSVDRHMLQLEEPLLGESLDTGFTPPAA